MPLFNSFSFTFYNRIASEETAENDIIPLDEYAPAIATTITATALFLISPPPLPAFPPQGLPQPGSLATGGGALPSTVIGVRN